MGLLIQKPEGVAGSIMPAIIVGLFVAFGGVLFGYAFDNQQEVVVLNRLTGLDMILVPLVVSWE